MIEKGHWFLLREQEYSKFKTIILFAIMISFLLCLMLPLLECIISGEAVLKCESCLAFKRVELTTLDI